MSGLPKRSFHLAVPAPNCSWRDKWRGPLRKWLTRASWRGLLRLLSDCPQLFSRQNVFFAAERLLCANQIIERNHSAFASKELFSAVRTAQTSRSRVTSEDPCSIAANPPTMTNAISASHSRSISRFRSFTQLPAGRFQLERQIQCFLVLPRTLVVREAQALVYERQVEARAFSLFDGDRMSRHGGQHSAADFQVQLRDRKPK